MPLHAFVIIIMIIIAEQLAVDTVSCMDFNVCDGSGVNKGEPYVSLQS